MSIRARLVLLCLAIILPVMIGAVWGLQALSEQERSAASINLTEVTRALAAVVDREIERRKSTVRALALSPSLRAEDLAAFYNYAKSTVALTEASIVFVDAKGVQRLNTRLPLGADLPKPRAFVAQRGKPDADEVLLSDVYLAPMGKRYSFAVRAPVIEREQVMGYVGLGSYVDVLQQLLHAQRMRPGWNATILDSSGTIVARRLSPEEFIGERATDHIRAELRIRREGLVDYVRRNGVPTLTAFAPIGDTDWTLVMSMPEEAIDQQYGATFEVTLAVALAMLAIAVLGATYVAARIDRHVHNLVTLARAVGQGEVVQVPKAGPTETRIVANELKAASERIRSANRSMEQTIRDGIAATRRGESALLEDQRLQMFARLLKGIAHDFNNVLQTTGSAVELAARTSHIASVKTAITSAKSALQRGATLTRQLGTFAQGRAYEKTAIDLAASIEELRQLLEGTLREKVEVAFDLAPNLWPIHVDRAEFDLAMVNIALDAREAMFAGGRLGVTAVNRRVTADEGLDVPAGEYVQLSFKEHRREPFSAQGAHDTSDPTRSEESGLGLAHVQALARHAGGRLEVRRDIGEVVLLLPRALQAPRGPATIENLHVTPQPSRQCVLFIDDDPLICQTVGTGLEALGFDVESTHDPGSALTTLSHSVIHVVLSDIVMPGQGGITLAEEIGRRYPGMPVVLATGHADADLPAAWPYPILRKPYSLEQAAQALRAALNARTNSPG